MYDEVARMTKMFLSDSIAIFNMLDNNEMKEASRRNVAYFSVALELFILEEQDSNFVDDLMAPELANIDSSSRTSYSTIFGYNVDYTQFTIRGHYSDSQKLQNYFKALMWYGMMSLELSSRTQVIQASLDSLYPFEKRNCKNWI